MQASELLDALKEKFGVKTDMALAEKLGMTPAAFSKWRNSRKELKSYQIANMIMKSTNAARKDVQNAPNELIDSLKEKFGVRSDIQLSQKVGMTNVSLSNWRKKGGVLKPYQVASLVKKAAEIARKDAQSGPGELLDSLQERFTVRSDLELSKKIGTTYVSLSNWRKKGGVLKPYQITNLVKKAVESGKKDARKFSIKPIVEYFPVHAVDSKQGKRREVLDPQVPRLKALRAELGQSHGIYIFYNSQCRAIYVGKAKRQNLWNEMNNAFNRERGPQEVWQVSHPTTGKKFVPAHQNPRKIVKKSVYIHDIAYYFSAYEIERDLIDNAEALIIRAFANDLTNIKMETISVK